MNPLEALCACLLGIFLGTFTGLSPGIHINTVAFIMLVLPFGNSLFFAVAIAAMSITHCFVDFVPSILLGAPESETSSGMLPGHKLLMAGKGFYALKLALIGCIFGLFFSIAAMPVLALIISRNLEAITASIPFILSAALLIMLFSEKTISGILWSAAVIALSGILGFISLNYFADAIFPLATGFFAGASLLYSLVKSSTPKPQKISEDSYSTSEITNSAFGAFAGAFVSMFPALGPNNAYLMLSKIYRKMKKESYLVLHGSISVSSMLLSFLVVFLIGKARTGSAAAIKSLGIIDNSTLLLILSACIFSGAVAYFIADFSARFLLSRIFSINYGLLNACTFAIIAALVSFLSSFQGLLLFATASSIGLIANSTSTRRSNAMAFLIIPTLALYFPALLSFY